MYFIRIKLRDGLGLVHNSKMDSQELFEIIKLEDTQEKLRRVQR